MQVIKKSKKIEDNKISNIKKKNYHENEKKRNTNNSKKKKKVFLNINFFRL